MASAAERGRMLHIVRSQPGNVNSDACDISSHDLLTEASKSELFPTDMLRRRRPGSATSNFKCERCHMDALKYVEPCIRATCRWQNPCESKGLFYFTRPKYGLESDVTTTSAGWRGSGLVASLTVRGLLSGWNDCRPATHTHGTKAFVRITDVGLYAGAGLRERKSVVESLAGQGRFRILPPAELWQPHHQKLSSWRGTNFVHCTTLACNNDKISRLKVPCIAF